MSDVVKRQAQRDAVGQLLTKGANPKNGVSFQKQCSIFLKGMPTRRGLKIKVLSTFSKVVGLGKAQYKWKSALVPISPRTRALYTSVPLDGRSP